MNKRNINIDLLKALAVILVLNSHLDSIYPVSKLATGGALGNTIFFMISGFLLINIKENFAFWYGKKCLKIYIPVYIFTIFLLTIGFVKINSIIDIFNAFIWPTEYWFIGALVIFYIPYYVIIKHFKKTHYKYLYVVLLIMYFGYYSCLNTNSWIIESSGLNSINGLFKLIFYFSVMISGAYLRLYLLNEEDLLLPKAYLGISFVSLVMTYIFKFMMTKNKFFMHIQFLNQFLNFICIFSLFIYVVRYFNLNRTHKLLVKCINFLSTNSLEIYVVQFYAIDVCSKLAFPINFIVCLVLVILLSNILKFVNVNINALNFKS